jgi:uncharacterized membrane-anchored protein
MKFSTRHTTTSRPGVAGTVRVDRRVGSLLRRARPGDIAVIDHLDLDRGTAEALVEQGVAAVVNAAPFISGRYPNLGPEVLARSGVVLVDAVGREVFTRLKDGGSVRLHDGTLYAGEDAVASGEVLELDEVRARMDRAREGLATQLQSFTHNTTEFLRREQDLLLHGQGLPELRTDLAGRPVVVVVRDFQHEADLRGMRRFIHEQRPVLIGVDAGADALLAARLRPDVVVVGEAGFAQPAGLSGQVVSDKALTSARDVVLHTDAAGRARGGERLDRLGVRASRVASDARTEDVAILLADARDASLVATVGTHATLDEFLDRQRGGLASTFLTRLRVGPRLVDARSVPVLYAGRVRLWQLLLILLAGVAALALAVALTPRGELWLGDARAEVEQLLDPVVDWIQGLRS